MAHRIRVATFSLVFVAFLTHLHAQQAPFPYVKATAYHVLPDTHNNESGYFSVCTGLDGSVYVGTAKYGENSFLVEFAPGTMRQKIVIDTHKLCGLSDKGYAAQAKIHTHNFVGPSGKVYVGSKQGYPTEEDKKNNVQYGGGYLMTYDPRTGVATNLGMPMKGQGIIDVTADESRQLIYVVTCEDQHWMVYDEKAKRYSEISGPLLTPYATTLVDSRGVASAITQSFRLAQYDPKTRTSRTRDIVIDGKEKWSRKNDHNIPIWALAADGRTAYAILLNDPTLLAIDLQSPADDVVTAKSLGKMVEGKNPDSRSGLAINPADGCVYALIATNNESGYGQDKVGSLIHVARFDPKTQKMEDAGVLVVSNPDWFTFEDADGKPKPWTHGFLKLPDGTYAPQYNQGLAAGADGTLYANQLYPFTLMKIDAFRKAPQAKTPAQKHLDFAHAACAQVRDNTPQISQIAEKIAQRHIAGGLIGVIYNNDVWPGQSIAYELHGRAGGIMNFGFDRPWKPEKDRTDAERANDIAIMSWQREPDPKDLELLKASKAKGQYIVGVGPKSLPSLSEHVALCDAWLDSGLPGADLRNQFVNILNGWALCGEIVSACTRQGKTPIMWRAFLYSSDGRKWMEPYFLKKQFHDDGITVPPIPAGEIGVEYLDRIEYLLRRFEATQQPNLAKAADLIAADLAQGKKTVVAYRGHTMYRTIGYYQDKAWAIYGPLHTNLHDELRYYCRDTPDDAIVVRLEMAGFQHPDWCVFMGKGQNRIILITSENDDDEQPNQARRNECVVTIDMGHAFGDACVQLPGYPFPVLPPSGAMQALAYECLDAEVQSRIKSGN